MAMAVTLHGFCLVTGFWTVIACAQVSILPDSGVTPAHSPDGLHLNEGDAESENRAEMLEFNVGDEPGYGRQTMEEGNGIPVVEGGKVEAAERKMSPLPVMVLQEIRELKETVNGLRLQNNIMYKQMKAFHKTCSASSAAASSSSSSSSNSALPDQPQSEMISSLGNNAIQSDALRMNPFSKTPCHKDFAFYPEHNGCYKLTAEGVTWRMARDRCLSENSDLATVESARKQRFFIERAKSSPETRHCDFWIGLVKHSSSETNWKWLQSDQQPSFTNWNFNEPNNGKGNEHCTQMLWIFHWKWNDAPCNYGNACYICQAKPYA